MTNQCSLVSCRIVAFLFQSHFFLRDQSLSSSLIDLHQPIIIHNIIMRKSTRSSHNKPHDTTAQTIQPLLPPPSLTHRFKNNRSSTQRSLSDSIVSTRSQGMAHKFKFPNSFYNDHSHLYQNRSKVLLEKNRSFQSRPLSLSQRKRYQSDSIERIAIKHQQMKSQGQSPNKPFTTGGETNREIAKKRFQDVMSNKYKKLVHGKSVIKVGKQLLQSNIKRSMSESSTKKWKSPFIQSSLKDRFQGQQLLPKKIERIYGNDDPSQLKVLNLDRLFRVKNGKLGNIVPLPAVKLHEVSAKSNIIKTVLNKDRIHDVINEYNSLLRLMKLKQAAPRLGVKGKTFTKSPTIEELMGIKLNPTRTQMYPSDQLLSEEIFVNHCAFYKQNFKKDSQIQKRLLSGLTQEENGGMSLAAFTRFYTLFINCIASSDEKSTFLAYFFVPYTHQKIEFSDLKTILEVMCKELPRIDKLNLKTDLLSSEQKSKIFLEALNRVLFGDIQQDINERGGLNRQILKIIFQNNPDATDLLLRLIQVE